MQHFIKNPDGLAIACAVANPRHHRYDRARMKVAWVLVGALLFGCGRHHSSSGQVSGTPDAGSGTEVTGGTGGGSRGSGGSPGGGDLDASADAAVDASPFPAFDVAGPDTAPV